MDNSNLYLDMANFLNSFNGLVEQHENDFLMFSCLILISAFFFVLPLYYLINDSDKNGINKIKLIIKICVCIMISVACVMFYLLTL